MRARRIAFTVALIVLFSAVSFWGGTVYNNQKVTAEYQKKINEKDNQISSLSSRTRDYYFESLNKVSKSDYDSVVNQYNQLVDKYNSLARSTVYQPKSVHCTSSYVLNTTYTNCY